MSGEYHYIGDPNIPFANGTNSHYSGNFTDPTGAVTGCTGNNASNTINIRQTGGQGYGMSLSQSLAGFNKIPDYTSYINTGINSSENLDVSKQYNPSMELPTLTGGRRRGKRMSRGGSSLNYYGFDKPSGDNLSLFAGSGYPPMNIGSQNLMGGKKRKSRKIHKYSQVKHKKYTRHMRRSHKRYRRKHTSKRHMLGLKRKKTSKLFKHLIMKGKGKKIYKGGYSQYMDDEAFSSGYGLGGPLDSDMSSLANPIPIKTYNSCSDPFGPK